MTAYLKGMRLQDVKETMLDFPLFIISSPFKGFDEMKHLNRGKISYAVAILIIYGLVSLMQSAGSGFIITQFYQASPVVNVPYVLLMAYAPMLLFSIANWSVTTITDGKGKLRDILLAYTYSLYPAIICMVIGIALSNYVTKEEAAFATFFFVFARICNYFYLFIGLVIIHEYTFTKAVLTIILTVLAMLIIIFVMALFISLFSEVISFFMIVFEETVSKL